MPRLADGDNAIATAANLFKRLAQHILHFSLGYIVVIDMRQTRLDIQIIPGQHYRILSISRSTARGLDHPTYNQWVHQWRNAMNRILDLINNEDSVTTTAPAA